ncbi:MAG TPA: HEAT repeat domain-containing protein [Pyrinomonadaceae bacterium]
MRTTRDLRRLTGLTNLILTAVLALACGAAAQARQAGARETRPAASAASLLATIKAVDSDPTPREARARNEAVEGLKRMGAAAVPALREFLKTEKDPARVYAAAALAGIEPSNTLARQALTDVALNGKGDEVIEATVTLAGLDPEEDAAVPALVRMASKSILIPSAKNMRRMRGSALALALTPPGLRALTPLLAHWDSWVRQAAVFAFDERTESLGGASAAVRAAVAGAVPRLVKALADKDEIVRGVAAESLEQLGGEALPELRKAAAGGDRKLAAAAAELLRQMGRG